MWRGGCIPVIGSVGGDLITRRAGFLLLFSCLGRLRARYIYRVPRSLSFFSGHGLSRVFSPHLMLDDPDIGELL